MVLALGFAELLAAVILLTAGITGSSLASVVKAHPDRIDPTAAVPPGAPSVPDTVGGAASSQTAGKLIRDSTGRPLSAAGHGVVVDPGVNVTAGAEPQIMAALRALAAKLGATVHVISGFRTPAQSVAVGGGPTDPHTLGLAADIGIDSSSRQSVTGVSDSELASVGLYRPFPGAAEINHVQLIGGQSP